MGLSGCEIAAEASVARYRACDNTARMVLDLLDRVIDRTICFDNIVSMIIRCCQKTILTFIYRKKMTRWMSIYPNDTVRLEKRVAVAASLTNNTNQDNIDNDRNGHRSANADRRTGDVG